MWSGDATERLFPAWHMRDDPPRSWMWDQKAIAGGALAAATAEEVRAVFSRLAREPD